MLSYNESLKILKETNALLEGHFVLSSGLHSNKYGNDDKKNWLFRIYFWYTD